MYAAAILGGRSRERVKVYANGWSDGAASIEANVERALAIKEKAFGADHPDVADTLNNLVILSASSGNSASNNGLVGIDLSDGCPDLSGEVRVRPVACRFRGAQSRQGCQGAVDQAMIER